MNKPQHASTAGPRPSKESSAPNQAATYAVAMDLTINPSEKMRKLFWPAATPLAAFDHAQSAGAPYVIMAFSDKSVRTVSCDATQLTQAVSLVNDALAETSEKTNWLLFVNDDDIKRIKSMLNLGGHHD